MRVGERASASINKYKWRGGRGKAGDEGDEGVEGVKGDEGVVGGIEIHTRKNSIGI